MIKRFEKHNNYILISISFLIFKEFENLSVEKKTLSTALGFLFKNIFSKDIFNICSFKHIS